LTPSDPSGRDPLSELRALWLQPVEPAPLLDPAALRQAARRFQRRIWARNLREWGAALVLVPLSAQGALRAPRWGTRLGLLCMALAGLYVSVQLYRRGRVGRVPESAPATEYLQGRITALSGQAELLESVWRWYLLPFVPGITLIYGDVALAALRHGIPAHAVRGGLAVLAGWLGTWLLFFVIARLNRRAARELRRQIATLSEH
jgi:hypothetical protein